MALNLRIYDVLTGERICATGETMNVLQVAASVAPRDGGPATAIININGKLREAGSNSLIVTTDADGPAGRLPVSLNYPINRSNAAALYCRRSHPYALKNSWSMAWRLIKLTRSADVMHIHGVYLANSISAYLTSIIHNTPYVLQPHGTLEPYQQAKRPRRKQLFDKLIGNRIIDRASALIAASRSEAENIKAQYPEAIVHVVPLGVSLHKPCRPSCPTDLLRGWLEVPREARVIFLGRLARKKRPDLLAASWAALPATPSLLFVGPPEDWDEAAIRDYLPEPGDGSVNFLPTVTPAEVAWLLGNAGIFVLPSENENFGIAVAEAMSYGCAVITTQQTATSDYVRLAKAGIVIDSPKIDGLRQGLIHLLSNPDLTRDMGKHAAIFASENFSWANCIETLEEIYLQIEH